VALPFCYSIAAGPLSTYVEDPRIRWLIGIPVGWPKLLYSYFFFPVLGASLVDNENTFFLFIIGSDVLLYTFIIYFALLMFSFKPVAIKQSSPPPPPDVL
jgi:hypothetical protein